MQANAKENETNTYKQEQKIHKSLIYWLIFRIKSTFEIFYERLTFCWLWPLTKVFFEYYDKFICMHDQC